MKNLSSNIQIIIFLIVGLTSFGSVYGQIPTPPIPPTSPTLAYTSHSTIEVSDKYNHGGDYQEGSKSSSDQNYRYTSIFEKDLTDKIEAILIQELGEPSVVSKKIKRWNHINGEKVKDFQIMLRDGKMKVIYKNGTPKIMKQLSKITKAVCKVTYKSNCD